jgi:hypothetical protein
MRERIPRWVVTSTAVMLILLAGISLAVMLAQDEGNRFESFGD